MAITIKEKTIELFMANPNGNVDNLNTSTRYTIQLTSRKEYAIISTPCNKTPDGYKVDGMAFFNNSVPLIRVSRKSAKTQRICEEFLESNIDAINTAYLNNGIEGIKEVVRDLFRVA